jgi:hypothetical protein
MREAFDTFIRALEHMNCKPQVRDRSAMACCPAHEDHTPSMSVKCAGTGRVLVHCFAGCETESILAAMGVGWSVLFVDDGWPEGGVVRYQPDFLPMEVLGEALRRRGYDPDADEETLTPPSLPMPGTRRTSIVRRHSD